MKKINKIKIFDYLIVVASISMLFVTFGLTKNSEPVSLSPGNGESVNNVFVLFEFENADVIFIDDNKDFTSPERYEVKDNFVIKLDPGVYYWKLEGNGQSEIREFTIESEISLRLENKEGKTEVVNAGSEELEVRVYQFGELKENIILDTFENSEVSGDKIIGEKND